MKYNKYGNKKTQIDGYTFDSKAEAARYQELKLLQASGDIKELELQPEFTLIPAQKINSKLQGKITERAVKYKADFAYKQLVPFTEPKEWVDVVE
ncbi:MAG: DUF1064 domain-containing protein, partial [Defluviitaleaceae bacterium]|nr:DUF1064 domain-containing protein [Defluviitaleaceae bacterium]